MSAKLQPLSAQMLESVDKSVSNTDAERRAGSTPALGTRLYKSPLANRQICKGIFFVPRKFLESKLPEN